MKITASCTFLAPVNNLLAKVQKRLFWAYGYAPSFYKALRRLKPDMVHAHFALDGVSALPIVTELDIPLVVTLHGYDVSLNDSAMSQFAEGRLYLRHREELWKQAHMSLCISELIRDQALQKGYPPAKLRVHYTGIDLSRFKATAQQRDPNMILFVARLVEKKGCSQLLRALSQLRYSHPNSHLVVIGAGPLEAALRAQSEAAALPCEFLGSQPTEVVRQYMASARVFCVPSVTAQNGDSEGLGMVFLEALAVGTPVVSYDHGGISEAVPHGIAGLLAEMGDHEGLSTCLAKLLSDQPTWDAYSAAGPLWVAQHCDLAKQAALLETIYSDATSSA